MTDEFLEVITAVCGPLDALNVTYAITGSIVSSLYGEPITSLDVNICLRMSAEDAKRLDGLLPARRGVVLDGCGGGYCSDEAVAA